MVTRWARLDIASTLAVGACIGALAGALTGHLVQWRIEAFSLKHVAHLDGLARTFVVSGR
jgi:uncharacterized membrane protein